MEAALGRRLERAFWSWQARTWDELLSPPAVAARVDATADRFAAFLRKGVVLDAACGTGLHMAALHHRGFDVIGLDFADGMAGRAARHGPAVRADLTRPWPIAPASVDGVLSVFTLQFFPPAAFLARISDCLRTGGIAMVEWPSGKHALPLPKDASLRLRVASNTKRASVAIGGRLGIAKAYDRDQVVAAATAFDVLDVTALERSHLVVLRRK